MFTISLWDVTCNRMVEETAQSSERFLERIRHREPEAVEGVVKEYTQHLFRGALGLGFNTSDARELVQRVWATFIDVVPNFKGASHIRTFIFGILYNKASELRREQVRFDIPDPVENVMETRFTANGRWQRPPEDPEKFLIATETMELIRKCLDALPLAQRMAFCLREIDEHGGSDICKVMNVTVTNLGVLLYRAKNRLRECIEGKISKKSGGKES